MRRGGLANIRRGLGARIAAGGRAIAGGRRRGVRGTLGRAITRLGQRVGGAYRRR